MEEITHPGFALLTAQGCRACHDVIGTAKLIGPPLTNVRERLSAAEIRQSIVDPNAVIAEGFQKDLMLANFADTLSDEQLDQLVAYLSGEVSLSERLAHPAVHLLALILLFNAGITWGIRRADAAAQAPASPAAGQEPAAGETAVATSPSLWERWGAVVVAIPLVTTLYLWERAESSERLAETLAATEAQAAAAAEATAAVIT